MIRLKEQWAANLDGERQIPANVAEYQQTMGCQEDFEGPEAVGNVIDFALAVMSADANGRQDFLGHLDYVISQLTQVRENVRAETPYEYWMDAKHAAAEESLNYGHAWITGNDGAFEVVAGDSLDYAPKSHLREYKNGQEQ